MWETSPPAAPLLLKATAYTYLECGLDRLHSPPLIPPILGGDRSSKSPKLGGFRGLDSVK